MFGMFPYMIYQIEQRINAYDSSFLWTELCDSGSENRLSLSATGAVIHFEFRPPVVAVSLPGVCRHINTAYSAHRVGRAGCGARTNNDRWPDRIVS